MTTELNKLSELSLPDENALRSFCQQHQIAMMVIFGSASTGRMHRHSDLDIAILLQETIYRIQHPQPLGQSPPVPIDHQRILKEKLALINEISLLFSCEVDLIILTPETDPLLLWQIFSAGRCLYQSSPELFRENSLRAWKLYIDTEKFRRWEREYIHKFIREHQNGT